MSDSSSPAKPQSKPKRSRREFSRACQYLWPYRKEVVVAVVSAFASGLIFTIGLSAMFPIITVLLDNKTLPQYFGEMAQQADAKAASGGKMFNNAGLYHFLENVSQHVPQRPVWTITFMFGVILALAMVGNVFRFCHEYLSDKSAISAINDIRTRLYDHILHLPVPYFGLHGTSDVTSRLVNDAQTLQDGFKNVLGPAVAEPIKAVLALTLAAIIDWRLTIFIIFFAPIMASVIKKFGKKVRRASRSALQSSSSMLGQIEGTLVGIRVVKSATAERFERRRYARIMDLLHHDHLKMALYEAYSTPTLETLGMCAVGCVLIVASWEIFELHTLSRGGFLLLLACLVSIGESLRKTTKLNTVLQKSNAAASRIFELLDTPIERPSRDLPIQKMSRLRGLEREITFEKINFQYDNTQHLAIDNVSLTVKKGQSVAIVGRNGSGKTTLLSLLPRYFEPASGAVLIDGVDVRQLTLKSLRQHIAIVTQDAVVFPGTIAENIAYGHPAMPLLSLAPDSKPAIELLTEVEAAAKEAFAHEFIVQKPEGYATRLEGLGSGLSGGQKQRLNIARAILRNAPILILDEATSQVDAESEKWIQVAVEKLMHNRTTFVIAHRFSTIKSADTIVVMEQGRILDRGKHDELMDRCEIYRSLYDHQLMP